MLDYLLLLAGFLLLIAGGEFLVKGAVSIAYRFKISPLVIGMTIVSFGTSAPELLVSIGAATSGHPDLSIGAVIGSNISNLALVLGLTVIIFPIIINKTTLRIDWPLMMFATLLFFMFTLDGMLGQIEGIFFLLVLVSFSGWIILKSRRQGKLEIEGMEVPENPGKKSAWYMDVILLLFGIIGLSLGAQWLIEAVVSIAKTHGISERVISVTVVAFGTSLPELVTSCTAAYRKQTDISIGNLIGSNVFNILAILGITAIIEPIAISKTLAGFDMYIMLGISILVLPLMYFGKKLGRLKGLFLVLFYFIYIFSTLSFEN